MDFKDFVCSIDKVRLKVMRYPDTKLNRKGEIVAVGVTDVMRMFHSNNYVTYKQKTSVKDYRHNFYFRDYNECGIECSFWLGIEHNAISKGGENAQVDVVLEYNPNKCAGSKLLEYLLADFFRNDMHVEVSAFDFAIDIPCNITHLKPVLRGNRSYRPLFMGGDNQTHYIGTRGSDGAVKIYNKSRELKIQDSMQLTRYEVTFRPKTRIDDIATGAWEVDKRHFVELNCVNNIQLDMSLTGTDKVLFWACAEHPEWTKELSRDKRKKIEQLLADNCSITFDFDVINKVVSDYFKTIYTF